MGIKFKYNTAAVVIPEDDKQKAFGQKLVLQGQQNKYQGQQAGYDRLFRAGSQLQQQNWQGTRDKQINDFQTARDKQQFDWKQQEAETARQAGFLDDARKMSTGIIMDDIKNGAYDKAIASKLRQNLIEEAEALGNPNLDATQRDIVLKRIRAARLLLTANRLETPPKPTPDEDLRGAIHTLNGRDWRKDKDGIWQDVTAESDKQGGRGGQQQPPQRPTSIDDLLATDQKARAELKAYEEQEIKARTNGGTTPITPEILEKAREQARKAFEKDLGLGTPTTAPQFPVGPMRGSFKLPEAQAPTPGVEGSILETVGPMRGSYNLPGAQAPTPGVEGSILETEATPAADMPIAPPDPEQQALAQKLRDGMNGKIDGKAYDAAYREWTSKYGNSEEAEKYFNAADELIKSNGGEYNKEWQGLINKGHNAKNGPINPFAEGEPQEAVQQAPPTTQPPSPAGSGQPPAPAGSGAADELAFRAQMREKARQARDLGDGTAQAPPNANDPFNAGNWKAEELQTEIGSIDQKIQAALEREGGELTIKNDVEIEDLQRERARLDAIMQKKENAESVQRGIDGVSGEGSPESSSPQSQGEWSDIAEADKQAVPATAPEAQGAQQPSNQAPAVPNFKSLSEGAANDAERAVVSQVESLYQGQSPDVQAAISVALDPNALDTEVGQALIYLRDKGIDMNALGADAEKSNKPGKRAKGRMRDKYGSSYDSF